MPGFRCAVRPPSKACVIFFLNLHVREFKYTFYISKYIIYFRLFFYLRIMTGQELFEKYTNKRDYSGSDEDQYAKLLMTIRSNIFDKIYSLLEKAEADGKRLHIETRRLGHPLLNDELTIEDIILV